jgi:hypothetical protein
VVAAVVLVGGSVLWASRTTDGDGISESAHSSAAGPVPLAPVWRGERRRPVPTDLRRIVVPGTYVELASFKSRRSTLIHVFTGRLRGRATKCIGLRTRNGFGLSCESSPSANAATVRVLRTTVSREAFVSGVVAPSVARLVAADSAGRTRSIEVAGAAFAFQGPSVSIIGAYDSHGRPID